MDTAGISLTSATRQVSSISATSRIDGIESWLSQYRADQGSMNHILGDSRAAKGMDSTELLRLQAMTQRFSLQTDLMARMADRCQSSVRQLLQQGG